MNSGMIKLAAAGVLIVGGAVALLVSASGHGGVAPNPNPNANGTQQSAASLILANKQSQLRNAQDTLATVQNRLQTARQEAATNSQGIQAVEVEISQANESVAHAEQRLRFAQEQFDRAVEWDNQTVSNAAAMGVQNPPTRSDSANGEVLSAMRDVEQTRFQVKQQIQMLLLRKSDAEARYRNSRRAVDDATRDVQVASSNVEQLQRDIAIAMTPVTAP